MKKITTFLFFIITVVIFSYTNVSAEVIKSFDSQIMVNLDSSVSVTEIIIYDSEDDTKHGIFRDIRPVSSEGESMDIKHISVINENGNTYQWQRQTNNDNVRLKIGDPNTTFKGQKTYIIKYNATNAVANLDDEKDEIYWNVTGNNWPFPIEKATAQVFLPSSISMKEKSCYVGEQGSTEWCSILNRGFYSERKLFAGEGMSIAVSFPSGIVKEYDPTFKDKAIKFLTSWWPLFIPIITFIFMYRKWSIKGKDPKGKEVIVPQYDVPDDLTPFEVGVIVNEKSLPRHISAEIVYLATKGYIKIEQQEKKIFGFIENRDYIFTCLYNNYDILNEFDKELLNKIFTEENFGSSVTLSDLKNKFYKNIPSIFVLISNAVLTKGYYKNLPNYLEKKKVVSSAFGVLSIVLTSFGYFLGFFDIEQQIHLVLVISIAVSFTIFFIFQRFMPSKTQKGVEMKEHLLGLKEYLRIAEKDRLAFHNAPDKNPQLFEKLLPYAMVFGVEELWAKEFEGIYTTPPSWYVGSYHAFSAVSFGRDMSSLDSFVSKTVSSTPSRGGSGGGGSSGGGGGGGGGGSW